MSKTKLKREAGVFPPSATGPVHIELELPFVCTDQCGGMPGLIEAFRTDRGDCRVHSLPRGMGSIWIEHEQR